jgi:hypothetical protein
MATPPDFSVGQVLTAAQMNAVGLWKITTDSFTNVSSRTLSNIFSSDFNHYHIIYSVNSTVVTSGRILTVQLRNSGGTSATNYVSAMRSFSGGVGTATWEVGGNSTTLFYAGYLGEPGFAPASGFMNIYNPNAAADTTQTGQAFGLSSGVAYYNMTFGGVNTNNTAYTDLVFAPTADNMTGNITVYGYRK